MTGGKTIKYIGWIYSIFNVLSFAYIITTGHYNGDYIVTQAKLPIFVLIFLLWLSILPYWIVYQIYLYFRRFKPKRYLNFTESSFKLAFILLCIWNFFVTIIFGVGKMANEVYSAPMIFTMIIVVTNRIPLNTIGRILICMYNRSRFVLLIVGAILGLSILRNSLGSFMHMAITIYLVYSNQITHWVKKHKIISIGFILLFPTIVGLLYEIRDIRRDSENYVQASTMPVEDLLFGKFVGRMSSYSNLCVLIQESDYFYKSAQKMHIIYGYEQIIGIVLGAKFCPTYFPEKVMVEYYGRNEKTTYLTGFPGAYILAFYKSPISLMIVFLMFPLFIIIIFKLYRLIKFELNNELASLSLYGLVGIGSFNEFSSAILGLLMVLVFVGLIQIITDKLRCQ